MSTRPWESGACLLHFVFIIIIRHQRCTAFYFFYFFYLSFLKRKEDGRGAPTKLRPHCLNRAVKMCGNHFETMWQTRKKNPNQPTQKKGEIKE
jgi:hypothetical protein